VTVVTARLPGSKDDLTALFGIDLEQAPAAPDDILTPRQREAEARAVAIEHVLWAASQGFTAAVLIALHKPADFDLEPATWSRAVDAIAAAWLGIVEPRERPAESALREFL